MDQTCNKVLLAIRDSMDVLSGKWKIPIIGSLTFGEKRFKELQRDVDGITAKMLSKELRDLETNKLVKRTVFDTKPVTVEYRLTEHGRSLEKIIQELVSWGTLHREKIFEKSK
jgi:DNA-binding HxlR family transcriptional regulator